MNILLLTTPAQHGYSDASIAMEPKSLKQWLSQLPTSNVLETVQQLREAIETFNESQIEDAKRIKLLEQYKASLDLILYSYDELRLRQLPIPDIQRKSLAEDIMWLYLGLANGYKTVVLNSYENQLTPTQDAKVLLAVYRAMELIIHALIYAFRSRHPAPPLAYLELNQLYLFTEQDNALALSVKGVKDHAVTPSIDMLFKQFMLLVAADPNRIIPTQLYELHNALEMFANHCIILQGNQTNCASHSYLADLMEDAAPMLAGTTSTALVSDTLRTLDISPALSAIETWLANHRDSVEDFFDAHESQLLTHYLSLVKNTRTLQHLGQKINSPISLAIGMDSIRQMLGETTLPAKSGKKRATTNTHQATNPARPVKSAIHHHWHVEHDNRGKLCASGQFDGAMDHFSVGDIVGLMNEAPDLENTGLAIASILSASNNQDASTGLTMQLIDVNATAIVCQLLDAHGRIRQKIAGLYFPRNTELQKPASLLTPKAVVAHKHRIVVNVQGVAYDVLPNTQLYQTTHYVQFRFKAEKSKTSGMQTPK